MHFSRSAIIARPLSVTPRHWPIPKDRSSPERFVMWSIPSSVTAQAERWSWRRCGIVALLWTRCRSARSVTCMQNAMSRTARRDAAAKYAMPTSVRPSQARACSSCNTGRRATHRRPSSEMPTQKLISNVRRIRRPAPMCPSAVSVIRWQSCSISRSSVAANAADAAIDPAPARWATPTSETSRQLRRHSERNRLRPQAISRIPLSVMSLQPPRSRVSRFGATLTTRLRVLSVSWRQRLISSEINAGSWVSSAGEITASVRPWQPRNDRLSRSRMAAASASRAPRRILSNCTRLIPRRMRLGKGVQFVCVRCSLASTPYHTRRL